MSAAGELLLGPARETYRRQLTGRGYRPEARIVAAELGNDAGVIGAADLARMEASPSRSEPVSVDSESQTAASLTAESTVDPGAARSVGSGRWWRRRHT